MNRREFLLLGGAGALALAGCGSDAAPPEFDQARDPESQRQGDVEVLGFLIAEKRIVVAAAAGRPEILIHERAHAARLEAEIRGLRGSPPGSDTPPRDLDLLAAEEHFIAAAIDGLPKLAGGKRRSLLASMMAADAGHVALLRAERGSEPVTDAFVYGRRAS